MAEEQQSAVDIKTGQPAKEEAGQPNLYREEFKTPGNDKEIDGIETILVVINKTEEAITPLNGIWLSCTAKKTQW